MLESGCGTPARSQLEGSFHLFFGGKTTPFEGCLVFNAWGREEESRGEGVGGKGLRAGLGVRGLGHGGWGAIVLTSNPYQCLQTGYRILRIGA